MLLPGKIFNVGVFVLDSDGTLIELCNGFIRISSLCAFLYS